MLRIVVPASEDFWDPVKEEFIPGTKETKLTLEHSLLAISKWEQKYLKPFIGDGSEKYDKTPEEIHEYIKFMCMEQPYDQRVFNALTKENLKDITDYMQSKATATTINTPYQENKKKEIITSEVIYCWMIQLGIPSKYDKWHINRLLTLIEVVNIKNDPNPKTMNAREYAAWRKAENARRRAASKAKHH